MKTFLTEDYIFSSQQMPANACLALSTNQMWVLYFLDDSDILEFDILRQLAGSLLDLEL